jgi:hypothetical protein
VLGTLVTGCILVGLAVRFVLMPYLRDQLLAPVQETHKQVTENHHANTQQPTVLDRIADVQTDVNTLTQVLEGHMRTSDSWLDHITNELSRHKARLLVLEARRAREQRGTDT